MFTDPSVTIGKSVTLIGYRAFEWCVRLASVTIPDCVATLGGYAFAGCSSLTTITIPDSVTSIGIGAFAGCTGLTAIEVDGLNQAYSSLEGVLLNKSLDTLIACPGRKAGSYLIPDSVTSIGNLAFAYCISLTSVYFGGDAPETFSSYYPPFSGTSASIYYLEGTLGWGPTFGGRPTMAIVPDTDGDGIPDSEDFCPLSDLRATVLVGRLDSGAPNTLFPDGATIADHVGMIALAAKNHAKFVRAVTDYLNEMKNAGVLTGAQKGAIQNCAAKAAIP